MPGVSNTWAEMGGQTDCPMSLPSFYATTGPGMGEGSRVPARGRPLLHGPLPFPPLGDAGGCNQPQAFLLGVTMLLRV